MTLFRKLLIPSATLFFVVGAIATGFAALRQFERYREEHLKRALATIERHTAVLDSEVWALAKYWDPIHLPAVFGRTNALLVTKCVSDVLQFQFDTKATPEFQRRWNGRGLGAGFTLQFLDSVGFLTTEVKIPALTQSIDDSGHATAYHTSGSAPLACREYGKTASWNVSWNF